jgi:hypothetical protein
VIGISNCNGLTFRRVAFSQFAKNTGTVKLQGVGAISIFIVKAGIELLDDTITQGKGLCLSDGCKLGKINIGNSVNLAGNDPNGNSFIIYEYTEGYFYSVTLVGSTEGGRLHLEPMAELRTLFLTQCNFITGAKLLPGARLYGEQIKHIGVTTPYSDGTTALTLNTFGPGLQAVIGALAP